MSLLELDRPEPVKVISLPMETGALVLDVVDGGEIYASISGREEDLVWCVRVQARPLPEEWPKETWQLTFSIGFRKSGNTLAVSYCNRVIGTVGLGSVERALKVLYTY